MCAKCTRNWKIDLVFKLEDEIVLHFAYKIYIRTRRLQSWINKKNVIFWGKVVKFCAKIARNGKIIVVSIFLKMVPLRPCRTNSLDYIMAKRCFLY